MPPRLQRASRTPTLLREAPTRLREAPTRLREAPTPVEDRRYEPHKINPGELEDAWKGLLTPLLSLVLLGLLKLNKPLYQPNRAT